jgi:hypothetical protein
VAKIPGVTVQQWLDRLPPERRAAIETVRAVIRKRLPEGYREAVAAGMLTYEVPLSVYPTTYNGKPLWYAALASQKSYMSLYLMAAYMNRPLTQRLEEGFRKAGKRLDMGKSCIRFRDPADLALSVVGDVIAAVPMDAFVAAAEAARTRAGRPARRRARPGGA